MDPDDKFSPPLDGLSRGHKLHQVLTTVSDSDIINDTHYIDKGRGGPQIVGLLFLADIVDMDPDESPFGILYCNWWHMKYGPDWWDYTYSEIPPGAEFEPVDDGENDGYTVEADYSCGWYQEENEVVEGLTYFREISDDGWVYEPFDPGFESPKPLTRAILDTHLPQNIRLRHTN